MNADVEVRHGWTYRELQKLAKIAARHVSVHQFQYDERVDVALVAVVTCLLENEEPPSRDQLIFAGLAAVREMWAKERTTQGWTTANTDAPRYHQYWAEWHKPAQPFSDGIVDRIALGQLHAALTEDERKVLWLRALTPDVVSAAERYGLLRNAYARRYWAARDRANRLWFGEETPPPIGRRGSRKSLATGAARRMINRQRVVRGAGKR